MRIAIAIDDWKLPIFERHLQQSGYAFENGELVAGMLMLLVVTDNLVALSEVVQAASAEAARTGSMS